MNEAKINVADHLYSDCLAHLCVCFGLCKHGFLVMFLNNKITFFQDSQRKILMKSRESLLTIVSIFL